MYQQNRKRLPWLQQGPDPMFFRALTSHQLQNNFELSLGYIKSCLKNNSFKGLIHFYFGCMSVGLHVCMCTAHVSDANRVRRGLQMPQTGVTELSCGCQELNPGCSSRTATIFNCDVISLVESVSSRVNDRLFLKIKVGRVCWHTPLTPENRRQRKVDRWSIQ